MQISVKETTVFSVFHPDAHALFNTCSDLKKVAWELWDPKRRLKDEEKTVQLFRAFAPMLCKRPTRRIEDSVKEMHGGKFFIEEKLDGERIQLHKRGNEYFYCSRKGKDYTYLYGKHVGEGSLTPYIDKAFDSRIDEVILDGEMLVWDPVSQRNLPFGTLKTAALGMTPCTSDWSFFKIFDMLYLNGMSLLQKSLKFRRRNLKAYIKEVQGRLEYASEWEGRTAQDIRARMEEVMSERGEGLVIKHPDSEYVLNGRNKDWVKVKPEYMDNMGETVDVLVVAGNYGTGRRAGGVSTIICGVPNEKHRDENGDPNTFVRIGTGLSFADYIWVRQKPWKEWDPENPPNFLMVSNKGQDDKGDVYLEPEDSFILKVKAAEITASDQYHLGITMRFPRAIAIRDDLDITDCVSAASLLEHANTDKKRKMSDDGDGKANKKRKGGKRPQLLPQYKAVDLKHVEAESSIFEGMKFMVASDPKSPTGEADKTELLKLIKANGGKSTQIASNKKKDLLVVYGGHSTPYDIKLIVDKGVLNIIRPQWIKDCVAQGELVPLKKKYFFHATEERQDDPEYNLEEEDEDVKEQEITASPEPEGTVNEEEQSMDVDAETEADQKAKEEEDDPSIAEWFKVTKEKTPERPDARYNDTDSETEPDSDNEDVKDEGEDIDEPEDDWVDIPSGSVGSLLLIAVASGLTSSQSTEQSDVKMGESDQDMEYDQDLIFKHLFVSTYPLNCN
ncbi:hypothetical protein EIP86_007506 [Pleurotus ostreatoroseus]|nr:hypothetical protein EIP86_007506 [Pleurotus ostreatoroseus]